LVTAKDVSHRNVPTSQLVAQPVYGRDGTRDEVIQKCRRYHGDVLVELIEAREN
jgi:hypothetical protein